MKSIIFAAGIGSRLGELTGNKPKALVEISGITLLEAAIRKLKKYGIDEIIINVHHFADMIEEFLWKNRNFDIRIELSDEREQLLETGGGLMKASWFFDDNKPFLTYNVDVLTSLDITSLIVFHKESDSLVSLACKKRNTERYFLTDKSNRLCGWENIKTGDRIDAIHSEGAVERVGYSCVTVMNPEIFDLIGEKGVFSLTPIFLRLTEKHPVMVYKHDQDYWTDIANQKRFDEANEYFRKRDVHSIL